MAQSNKSVSFKNAMIDLNEGVIVEVSKDETKTYSLGELLREWDMVEGVSIMLKQTTELPSQEDDG